MARALGRRGSLFPRKDDPAKHKCPQREESQVNWTSYQWCSLYVCKVLQQALSVVDGGVEIKVGILPLAIQILSTQRTTMTTAEEGKDREWRRAELENPSVRGFVCVNENKAVVNVHRIFSVYTWKLLMCVHFCFYSLSIHYSIRVKHGDYFKDVWLSQTAC